jgi:hypothetical protein
MLEAPKFISAEIHFLPKFRWFKNWDFPNFEAPISNQPNFGIEA